MAKERKETEQRLVDISVLMSYVGLGRNNAMKLGAEIGCLVKIGRRNLYDLRKVDQYLNSLTGVR